MPGQGCLRTAEHHATKIFAHPADPHALRRARLDIHRLATQLHIDNGRVAAAQIAYGQGQRCALLAQTIQCLDILCGIQLALGDQIDEYIAVIVAQCFLHAVIGIDLQPTAASPGLPRILLR